MTLTHRDCKLEILRLLDQHCKAALRLWAESQAALVAEQAGYAAMSRAAKDNPDEYGGLGCRPVYNPDRARAAEIAAHSEYEKRQSLFNYAVSSLIS